MLSLFSRIIKCLDKSSIIKIIKIAVCYIINRCFKCCISTFIAQFVLLISGSETNIGNSTFQNISYFLKIFSSNNLLLYVSILVVSFYVLTILLTLILTYFNLIWIQDILVYFQKNLYNYYLEKKMVIPC